jgi:DNA polymerase-1
MNGKSFTGPSGKVLDHLLQLQGLDRTTVLATNVVLCQSDGSEPGFGLAQSCCDGRLQAEIQDCETVIACGREAAYSLIGESNITLNRGYPHAALNPFSGKRQRIVVTNNPAMVLRDDGTYPELQRDFRLAINPLPKPTLPKVSFTDDVSTAKEWANEILRRIDANQREGLGQLLIASDIETRRRSPSGSFSEIVCAGFSLRVERAVVFGNGPCHDQDFLENYLKRIYEARGIDFLWHNGKYDVKVLRRYYDIQARVDEDSMLLSWALDERPGDPESGAGGHSLEWLLKDHLGWPKYEPVSVRAFKREGILRNPRELYEYNGFDTAGSIGLFEVLKGLAVNDNVWDKPYKSQLIRLSETLTKIELSGTIYDADVACDMLEAEVWPKLSEQRRRLRELSKDPSLNPNSPKQIQSLLYQSWGITHDLQRPRQERLGKQSTDKYVREKILRGEFGYNDRSVHRSRIDQFVQTLDDFKSLDKQRGTYLEGMVLALGGNNRIYTDYKIHGTESGRLSSSNPNLQNITRTKSGLPNIRRCFIPDPGCCFISADLSQAELRAIAVLSADERLRSIYLGSGRSLHKEVATAFYGENYSYEDYTHAKNINFGVAYWQSAYSFHQMYHMPLEEADSFVKWWWSRFPKVWEWTKKTEETVMSVGEIQSPFGHKRRFYVIPADESGRLHVVKEGINFLPQNIAANGTLWALMELTEYLWDSGLWRFAQPRITVHDSILVNCHEDYVDDVAPKMKQFMEEALNKAIGWNFPFVAELSIGANWGVLVEMPNKIAA